MLATGCTATNRAMLVASTATVVCDWAQTRGRASADWVGYRETNPMLGTTPSVMTVDGYFAIVAGFNALIWLAMPERYKSVVPTALIAVQADAIQYNVSGRAGLCGL